MSETEKTNLPKDPLDEKFDDYVVNFFLMLWLVPEIALITFPKLITLIISLLVVFLYLLYGLIVCKKNFRLHIRSIEEFGSWKFFIFSLLFIILSGGGIAYLFIGSGETLKEFYSHVTFSRVAPGALGLLYSLLITMLCLFFDYEEIKSFGKKQREIDELYEKGMAKDMSCCSIWLNELMDSFCEGKDQDFFKEHPLQAAKVFEGAQRLEEEGLLTAKGYYQLGLMYETGFACTPNSAKAMDCYKKAQTAGNDTDYKHSIQLRKQAKKRLDNLQKSN